MAACITTNNSWFRFPSMKPVLLFQITYSISSRPHLSVNNLIFPVFAQHFVSTASDVNNLKSFEHRVFIISRGEQNNCFACYFQFKKKSTPRANKFYICSDNLQPCLTANLLNILSTINLIVVDTINALYN